ncbi:hypothetical protein GCM10009789_71530 [Kribbella sancticallisti]|uniref:Uncharacterized protein n=1 Tax=Kribbella sancticallisti TaxID=460087 RepID=A0ABN2EJD1_9ACTN
MGPPRAGEARRAAAQVDRLIGWFHVADDGYVRAGFRRRDGSDALGSYGLRHITEALKAVRKNPAA